MDLGIRGRVVIVTGATGDIGRACVEAFAAEGARIAVVARTADKLEALARSTAERFNIEAKAIPGDLTRQGDITHLVETVERDWGPPEILCLLTGRGPRQREVLEENEPERWDEAYRVNLRNVIDVMYAVAPRMVANRYGRIVTVTSASVKEPMPRHAISTVFRAGVMAYVKHLSNEIASAGVTVNAVAPASIETQSLLQRPDLQARIDKLPVRRLGRPEECAAAVALLASEQAGFITGTCLQVDGGMTKSLV